MTPTRAEKHLAARMRLAMERHAGPISKRQGVCGAGIAWRRGIPSFVVQTDSTETVEELRAHLPSRIEGFPVTVEVESRPAWLSRSHRLVAAR
jgi:hypothetical protein